MKEKSHPERGSRGIRSIPPRTPLDVLRGGVTLQAGGGSLLGGTRRVSREPTAREQDWKQIVAKHILQKPSGREEERTEPPYERDGRIKWKAEVIDDYDGKGKLGIILQFAGFRLTETSFLRGSRYYGPDTTLFYSPISYQDKKVLLILATTGDIFEAQVVPVQKDVSPFFQEELHLTQLSTTHKHTTMAVSQENGWVIVSYNPHTQ